MSNPFKGNNTPHSINAGKRLYMYIVTCISLAAVLALYILLMRRVGQGRKKALKEAEKQLAHLDKKKRAEIHKDP